MIAALSREILVSVAEFLPCFGFSLAGVDKTCWETREQVFGIASILKRHQPSYTFGDASRGIQDTFKPGEPEYRIVVRIARPGVDEFEITRCAGCGEVCERNERLRDGDSDGEAKEDYDGYMDSGYMDSTKITRVYYFKYVDAHMYAFGSYPNENHGDQEDLCAECITKLCKCVSCGREGCRFCRFFECAGEGYEARMCRHGNLKGIKMHD